MSTTAQTIERGELDPTRALERLVGAMNDTTDRDGTYVLREPEHPQIGGDLLVYDDGGTYDRQVARVTPKGNVEAGESAHAHVEALRMLAGACGVECVHCPDCYGEGYVEVQRKRGRIDWTYEEARCEDCGGTGTLVG